MLKPPDHPPPAEPDRSIGESIERLLDDAVAYGRAEFELLKTRAFESVESWRRAAVLFVAAAVVGLAGAVTLFVGVAMALSRWIGPLGGSVVSLLLAAGLAGLLAWLALRDLERNA
jgi:hypothetical protein